MYGIHIIGLFNSFLMYMESHNEFNLKETSWKSITVNNTKDANEIRWQEIQWQIKIRSLLPLIY